MISDAAVIRNPLGRLLPSRCPAAPYAQGDLPERTVVHVQRARPGDSIGIEIKLVAMKQVRVDQGGQEDCARR